MIPSETLSDEQLVWLNDLLINISGRNIPGWGAETTGTSYDGWLKHWQQIVHWIGRQPPAFRSPALYLTAWQRTFADWNVAELGPVPIWIPDAQVIQRSNVGQWMRELEIGSFDQFHTWSTSERAEFWRQGIQRLGIVLATPATQTLDLSAGVTEPVWLKGARMNIVESCFQSDEQQAAIVFQQPGKPLDQISYGQLRRLTARVSQSLVGMGCRPGDAIAVVLPMTALSVPLYLGIVQAGCVVVSIADSFAPPEIATRLKIADAKWIFTYDYALRAGKQLPLYEKVCQSSQLPTIVLGYEDQVTLPLRTGDFTWSEFLQPIAEFDPHRCDPREPINLLFSSGTTGEPKAIPWDHTTPIKCALDGYCHQDIHPGDVCVWPTNLGWMMGPWLIFATLINRGTIGIYEDAPMGSGFGKFVEQARVRMLGVVPTIVKAWRSSGEMEAFDWSAIGLFSSTGETSQPSDMAYLSSLAGIKPIIEYCGGTEIGGGYITSSVLQPNFPAAFNTPAVGIDLVLLDPDGIPGDEGEVFLIPPSIGLSNRLLNRDHHQTYYADTPQLPGSAQLRRHGDHFRRLTSGIYQAGGRVDDTMNLGGIKISSAEIERVLNQLREVRETAAVAYARQGGPEELFVFVVAATSVDANQLLNSMNQQLKTELNPLFKIRQIILKTALPRTASGKVMRRELREELKQNS
jgi:acetyl-CoA synthetase